MTQPIKKRFIAGVVCPRCGEMDRTVMYRDAQDDEVRECISCGYSQTLSEHLQEEALATELTTRVTPVDGKAVHDEGVQALKIILPSGTPSVKK